MQSLWLLVTFFLYGHLIGADIILTPLDEELMKQAQQSYEQKSLQNQARILEQQGFILAQLRNQTSRLDEIERHLSSPSAPIASSSENEGTITLPVNSNGTYENHLDLNFPVMVQSGHKIMFTFTEFDIEEPWRKSCGRGCTEYVCWDWVIVKDSNGMILQDKACGNSPPGTFFSKTNVAVVTFHSNMNNDGKSFKGFSLAWMQI